MRIKPALAALGVALVVFASGRAIDVDASWIDREHARSTFTAATMQPPSNLRCTQSGLLQPVILAWNPPSTGPAVTGYRYTVGANAPVTLTASQTTATIANGLLNFGSYTFSLRAVGPGGWESAPVTATVSQLTSAITGCSVP